MTTASLAEVIAVTSWIDTHEHLVEEHRRLGAGPYRFTDVWGELECIPSDWSALIVHYALDDLVSAGLPASGAHDVRFGERSALEKWDVVAPYFEAARATGYLRAVDLTTERLFGLRLSRGTCEELDRLARELRSEGYYARVLRDAANVERCHVNSLEHDPFCNTASPALLQQDLSLYPLVTGRCATVEQMSGIEVGTLDDYVDVVEWAFERFGGSAVAAKLLWAYFRPLAVAEVCAAPRQAFLRVRRGDHDLGDRRQVEDFLVHHCLELCVAYDLPVKLHLGYLAGNRRPQLTWVGDHVADAAALVQAQPRNQFVLMHMAWPHQEALLAVAKHLPNAVVDLCWAWILAPLAARDFVQRALTTLPATKLLCFGGDYMTVENVVGHAELARRGLQAALEGLVEAEWLTLDRAVELVPLLMRTNAERLFRGQGAG